LHYLHNCFAIQNTSVEWELKVQASAPGYGSTALVGTSWFLEMNNTVSTNAIAFVCFLRFFCDN